MTNLSKFFPINKTHMNHFLKKSIALALIILCCSPVSAQKKSTIYKKGWIDFNKNGVMDVYENPNAPIDERLTDLLSQMTLEEKTCQLATLYGSGRVLQDSLPTPQWKNEIWKDGIANIDEQANGIGSQKSLAWPWTASINNRQTIQQWFVEETRLGIPVDFTNEGIRGLCHDRATMFPAQCGQGATWNRELISEIAGVTAREANALGYTNIYSPILDIARDPRWGRVVESYGEDPYLAGELGLQTVKTIQSNRLISTPKHFAVYSIPVGGRDEGTRTDPHVAPREMRTLLLEPFRKAFVEGNALGVMSSYNDYDGVPITGNHYFLTEILRNQFGFKGYVVSDSEAVEFLKSKHRVATDSTDVVAQVINAGLNVRTHFTPPADFILPLRKAVSEGKISLETIDSRVKDVLKVKLLLGLFDNPYRGNVKTADKIIHSPEHQAVSLKAALQSFVLLKNEKHTLPLSKELKKIAVIGPNANEVKNLICRYGPANAPITTVYEGIRKYLPEADVRYAKGCEIIDKYFPESELYNVPLDAGEQKAIDEAVALAKTSEVAILVLGGNERTVREEYSRSDLNLAGRQQQLLEAIYATGTPVVLLLIDGRAATINWAEKYIPAIIHGWFPGEFMGDATAKVLFGDYNPGGKLAVTFPKSVGQIPFAFPFKPGADSNGHVRVSGALYPFGYGLSYTTFAFGNLKISRETITPDQSVSVSITVENTGNREGDEVVQLYLRDNVSSVTTYEKMLRGFERVTLKPGEKKAIEFTLVPQDLGLWNNENQFVVEPGSFTVMVGNSSQNIKSEGQFTVIKQ
jgi:beta-glucosidase